MSYYYVSEKAEESHKKKTSLSKQFGLATIGLLGLGLSLLGTMTIIAAALKAVAATAIFAGTLAASPYIIGSLLIATGIIAIAGVIKEGSSPGFFGRITDDLLSYFSANKEVDDDSVPLVLTRQEKRPVKKPSDAEAKIQAQLAQVEQTYNAQAYQLRLSRSWHADPFEKHYTNLATPSNESFSLKATQQLSEGKVPLLNMYGLGRENSFDEAQTARLPRSHNDLPPITPKRLMVPKQH